MGLDEVMRLREAPRWQVGVGLFGLGRSARHKAKSQFQIEEETSGKRVGKSVEMGCGLNRNLGPSGNRVII